MIARGIGGKVFAEFKARHRNFVQGQQKKRLQRRFAASALCDPINIYIYDPPGVLVQIARKFGTGDLTVCLVSVYALAVVRATGHGGKPLQEVDTMQEVNGMTRDELEELKAALLKSERLEILLILRDAESLDDAVRIIERRLNG